MCNQVCAYGTAMQRDVLRNARDDGRHLRIPQKVGKQMQTCRRNEKPTDSVHNTLVDYRGQQLIPNHCCLWALHIDDAFVGGL
eukprot:2913293-Amphidinium_carterae.1